METDGAALAGLGVDPGRADLTVVQFSTAFCGPCRATRARLRQLQATRPGLVLVEVDAESHLDAVRTLGVDRTPTLLYLDRSGRLVGRSSGAPRPAELAAVPKAQGGKKCLGFQGHRVDDEPARRAVEDRIDPAD